MGSTAVSHYSEQLRAQRRVTDRRIFDAFPENRVATLTELRARVPEIPPFWIPRVIERLVRRGCVMRLGHEVYQAAWWTD